MTVREMLGKLDSRELTEWFLYDALDPFGQARADLRAGVIASTVANCHSTKGHFKPSDFVVKYGPRVVERKTPEQLATTARAITAMFKRKA